MSETSSTGASLREEFDRNGYISVPRLLSPGEVEAARAAMASLVAETYRLAVIHSPAVTVSRDEGETRANYAGVEMARTGSRFLMRFEAGVDPYTLSPGEAEAALRVLYGYREQDPAFEAIADHPRIRAVLDDLLGPGSLLFQDMALVKPPFIGSEKPWHQDDAYFAWAPIERIVGVWIALDDAGAANGCMQVLPGAHRAGALRHWHSSLDCEIVPGRLDPRTAVPVELPSGGALFFSGLLPHRTPPNRSSLRRRALQLHYRGADTRRLDPPDYDRVFVEADGTAASCRAARAPAP